jgi:hypothetical protein
MVKGAAMVAQSKSVIHLSTVIGEDRKLVVELPPDTPTGEVDIELVLRPKPAIEATEIVYNSERERVRAILLAKGALSTMQYLPDDVPLPTDEEIYEAGILPPGARPSEEILREIRDEEDE